MRTRHLIPLAVALAAVVLACAPALAQAEPHWYVNSVRLAEGKPKVVKTAGQISFTNTATGVVVRCTVIDAEQLENPVGGGAGVDLMKAFKITKCGPNPCPIRSGTTQAPLVVTALNLPWPTKLVEVPPIADEISGIEIRFACKGTTISQTYSGTLSPWVQLGDLEFNSPITGMLGLLAVNGIDNFVPATVTAKNP